MTERPLAFWLLALALALALGGCGSDDGPGPGSTTECNREPDLSRATATEFPGRFWVCYDGADMDVEGSVESCVQETPGLSAGCAACYGDFAGCVDTVCGEDCNDRGDDTLACTQCLTDACYLGLTSCSGVASPAVQPQ